jgi:hypothetical protein
MKLRLRSHGQPELRRVSIFVRAALRALTVVGLPILVLAPFTTGGNATPAHQPTRMVPVVIQPSRLQAGKTLRGGSWLTSPNGRYRLEMQASGDLVLTSGGHVLWSSHTARYPGAVATMQSDGNFVIYEHNRAIWNSRTSRRHKSSAYYLLVEANGNVVVDTQTHKTIWETHT